jgi:hypothetical protein
VEGKVQKDEEPEVRPEDMRSMNARELLQLWKRSSGREG